MLTKTESPQLIAIAGKPAVILDPIEYSRLADKAGWEPALPPPLPNGNYPALETAAVILARKIIRARRTLGWSQAELARRAGVRPRTLAEFELAQRPLSTATFDKIDRALTKGEARKKRKPPM